MAKKYKIVEINYILPIAAHMLSTSTNWFIHYYYSDIW